MKYRKKPVVVEAVRYWAADKRNLDLIAEFAGDAWLSVIAPNPPADDLIIDTLEGEMRVQPGDWIIRGINGEFYPCKPDIFDQTYEPVE